MTSQKDMSRIVEAVRNKDYTTASQIINEALGRKAAARLREERQELTEAHRPEPNATYECFFCTMKFKGSEFVNDCVPQHRAFKIKGPCPGSYIDIVDFCEVCKAADWKEVVLKDGKRVYACLKCRQGHERAPMPW